MGKFKVGRSGSHGTNSEGISLRKFSALIDSISKQDFINYALIPAGAGLGLGLVGGLLQNFVHELSLDAELKKHRKKIKGNISRKPIVIDIDATKEKEEKKFEKSIVPKEKDLKGKKFKLPFDLNFRFGTVKESSFLEDAFYIAKDKLREVPDKARSAWEKTKRMLLSDYSDKLSPPGPEQEEPSKWLILSLTVPALLSSFLIGYNFTRRYDTGSSEAIKEQLHKTRKEYIKSIYSELIKKKREETDELKEFLKKKSFDLTFNSEKQIYQEIDQEIGKMTELCKQQNETEEGMQKAAHMVKQAAVLEVLMYGLFPGLLASAITGSNMPAILNMVVSGSIFSLAAYNAYRENIDRDKEEKLKQTRKLVETLQSKFQEAPVILKYKKRPAATETGETAGTSIGTSSTNLQSLL